MTPAKCFSGDRLKEFYRLASIVDSRGESGLSAVERTRWADMVEEFQQFYGSFFSNPSN